MAQKASGEEPGLKPVDEINASEATSGHEFKDNSEQILPINTFPLGDSKKDRGEIKFPFSTKDKLLSGSIFQTPCIYKWLPLGCSTSFNDCYKDIVELTIRTQWDS
ncbi:hypothetical protein DSO57_1011442 [Entomophthora muscae]|uniref:Uncharacterized protein n=1 Tax=Entomophthora muscae TaxID=34485 RepID=A0ACC2RL11_9FUNG|nr:hypothetical protein DSO57_1011442 [Entomophthora muscae]